MCEGGEVWLRVQTPLGAPPREKWLLYPAGRSWASCLLTHTSTQCQQLKPLSFMETFL